MQVPVSAARAEVLTRGSSIKRASTTNVARTARVGTCVAEFTSRSCLESGIAPSRARAKMMRDVTCKSTLHVSTNSTGDGLVTTRLRKNEH